MLRIVAVIVASLICANATQIKFAFIADWSDGQPHKDVSQMVKGWGPSFIVAGGDCVYAAITNRSAIDASIGRYWSEWIYHYKGMYGVFGTLQTTNFYPCVGNHDNQAVVSGDRLAAFREYFGLTRDYYDFNRGPVHFIVVSAGYNNSQNAFEPDGITESSVQGLWVSNVLAHSTNIWKVVVSHQPPYTSFNAGVTHTNLDVDGTLSYPKLRWSCFTNYGVNLWLDGHVHWHENIYTNGIRYWTDGRAGRDLAARKPLHSAGSQFIYTNEFGASLITATETTLTVKAYTRRSTLVGSVTLTK